MENIYATRRTPDQEKHVVQEICARRAVFSVPLCAVLSCAVARYLQTKRSRKRQIFSKLRVTLSAGRGRAESGYKHAVFLREEHIMDAETRAIRQEIDATREAMTDKVEQLESRVQQRTDEVKEALDIRQVTSERPWTMVGIATGAGFMIGTFGAELLSLLRPMTGMAFLIGYAWGRFGQPGQ
jgi:ElaB/YqjD/DUF883 family membrane-anchored ribosome-binding protein